jgi:hypothetical protein
MCLAIMIGQGATPQKNPNSLMRSKGYGYMHELVSAPQIANRSQFRCRHLNTWIDQEKWFSFSENRR